MLNPQHLQTLVAVVRTGSFAQAARALGYTGSAVSQQVASLERQLKVELFERSAQHVTPTPVAELIAEQAARPLVALDNLEKTVSAIAVGRAGVLRLGSFPSASEALMPKALSRLALSHPQVAVRLDEEEPRELCSLLSSNELDAALVYRYTHFPGAWPPASEARPLLRERLLLVTPAGHRLAGTTDLAALEDADWIATRQGTAAATALHRMCNDHGFEPRISLRSNDYDVICGLVAAGLGIGVVPALAYDGTPGVAAAPLASEVGEREILTLVSGDSNCLLIDAFLSAIARATREVIGVRPGTLTAA